MPHIEFPVPGDNTFTMFQDGTIFDGELVLDKEADGSVSEHWRVNEWVMKKRYKG